MKRKIVSRLLIGMLASLMIFTTSCGKNSNPDAGKESQAVSGEISGEAVNGEVAFDVPSDAQPEIIETENGYPLNFRDIPRIPDGFVIAGIDAGGMTGTEFYQILASVIEKAGRETITLALADREIQITLSDLGLTWRNEAEVSRLVYKAAYGNLIDHYKYSKDIENGAARTGIEYGLDEVAVSNAVNSVVRMFDLEPKNASVRIDHGSIEIIPERTGVIADEPAAVAAILDHIGIWDGDSFTVEIPAEVNAPAIKSDVFEGIHHLASFRTDYWSEGTVYSAGRNQNVQTGAANVNGHWFMPGEEISTLSMIGPVDAEHGFALAGTYNDGDSIPQYGGGLCQVATTLYNAYLQVELNEVFRRPHSNTVSYVPLGMDAMIYPQERYDFVVENSTGHPLYIEMYCEGHDLVVNLYGKTDQPENRTVAYRSETLYDEPHYTIENEDMSLKPGEVQYDRGGHNRCAARVYKEVYIDGVLVEEIMMHEDEYKTMDAVRRYGPAIDSAGNHYYINDKGYAQDAAGVWYRLNSDGTFLDDPLAGPPPEDWSAYSTEE